jgi:hypothetical protein
VVWIALAVHGFVVVQDDLDDGRWQHPQLPGHLGAVYRMQAEELFFMAVALGVAQYGIGHPDLADVVEQGALAKQAQLVRRQPGRAAQHQ